MYMKSYVESNMIIFDPMDGMQEGSLCFALLCFALLCLRAEQNRTEQNII